VHVGTSPDDDPSTDIADNPGREDGAVDDCQDRCFGGRSEAQAEVSLQVRGDVKIRQVQ